MDLPHPSLLRIAVAALAVGCSICVDAAPAGHIQTSIEDGLARVNAARPSTFVDGQPVAATGITYREVFWTGKPRD